MNEPSPVLNEYAYSLISEHLTILNRADLSLLLSS